MKAEVMENREVTGPKEQLEIELSALQKQQWDIYSSIVDIYDTSQVSTATDSLIAFLQHQPILVGKYILASLLLYQGLPQQSLQILQQIPTLPNIENSDLCEAEQQLTLYYWFNARSDMDYHLF
jgi:hypothetical protein